MIGAKALFFDGEGAPVQPLGVLVSALRLIDGREVVEVDGDLVVLGTVDTLKDPKRAAVEPPGLLVLALAVENRGERGNIRCDIGMVWTQRPPTNPYRQARERFPTGVVARCVLQASQVVKNRCHFGVIWAERSFGYQERPLIQLPSLRVPRQVFEGNGEVVERDRHFKLFRPEHLFRVIG